MYVVENANINKSIAIFRYKARSVVHIDKSNS